VITTVAGIGCELRFEWNNELRQSQVYRDKEELHQAALTKREELIRRGWVDAPPHWQI